MARVVQTFINRLPEPLEIWVEPQCWFWRLGPNERFTAEFDAQGFADDVEPLPIEVSYEGEGADRRVMLLVNNQGLTEPSFFVDGEGLLISGEMTSFGRSRWVRDAQ